jgi:diguanylate cyclase
LAALRFQHAVGPLGGLGQALTQACPCSEMEDVAEQSALEVGLAVADLDHFKRFNDEFGHQAGDRLLKSATAAWSAQLRAVDQLARYGGEEFIALLPRATAELATGVLERLRAVTPAGQTFSAGVATWDGNETSEELIGRADQALYQAKDDGRDRIVVAAEEAQTASQPGPGV